MYALCGDKKEMFCVGTKGYSPPEQWKDMRGDVTWDIYSLGAVLHEMLTGENPTLPAYRRGPVREYDRGLWSALNKIIDKSSREYYTIKNGARKHNHFFRKETCYG